MKDIPLFSGKLSDKAVLNPSDYIGHKKELMGIGNFKMPKCCILCFFKSFYKTIEESYKPKIVVFNEDYPIYIFDYNGVDIAFVYPTIGSSAGTVLDEMIALGAKYFIFIGGVGTIAPEIERGEIIVPTKAIRDEGVSFHYEKPGKYSYPSKTMLGFIEKSLKKNNVTFSNGTTWTTDSPYRETRNKVLKYHKEGALTVEMEASMFFSIAKFRKVDIGAIFIAGDCIAKEKWNPRMKRKDVPRIETDRKKLLDYALDAFNSMDKTI